MPLLPVPDVHEPAVDFVNAPMLISTAFVLSAAIPAATSSTLFGVPPSLSVSPAI